MMLPQWLGRHGRAPRAATTTDSTSKRQDRAMEIQREATTDGKIMKGKQTSHITVTF
jgi:uncharacterized membrane protein